MRRKLIIHKNESINGFENFGKFRKFDEETTLTSSTGADAERKNVSEYPTISFVELYKYSTITDRVCLSIGAIFAILAGISNSLLSLTFGDATNVIVEYVMGTNPNSSSINNDSLITELYDGLNRFVVTSCSLGLFIMASTYVATLTFNTSALNQTHRIRRLFFGNILNMDVGWYDTRRTGDFASRVADDLKKVEEGIGEKVSIVLFYEVVFVTSIIQGLILGWELALICLVSFPVTTVSMGFISWISTKLSKQETEAYGEAGAIAEETLGSIRTVVSFGGESTERDRYDRLLQTARKNNERRSFLNGVSNGVMWMFAYASYSLGFWYGVRLIIRERSFPEDDVTYDAGTMVAIFFSVLTGTWFFGMASPYIETFGVAKGAASKIFGVIAELPTINGSKGSGRRFEKIERQIEFRGIKFAYPSRRDVEVLKGFDLEITAGETVALVGSSGCGKSTCIQLLQRFYDPDEGGIYIDGTNLTEFDLTSLRSRIGVVGQEPTLFETSIAENIRLGRPDASRADIERAASKANADPFVRTLPSGYETLVGERGAQLSGGQKQRIAIARAIVREPQILLLDEATSALDVGSEAAVQAALDEASTECTTLIVAHRLSTVRKADRIVVIGDGKTIEDGKHDDLMQKKGAYYELVMTQVTSAEDDTDTHEKEGSEVHEKTPETPVKSTAAASPVWTPAASFRKRRSSAKTSSVNSPNWASESTTENDFKISTFATLQEIMSHNSREWWAITIGCLCAIVTGAGMPIYAIVFGDVMGILAHVDDDYVQEQTNTYAVFFLIIGVVTGVATLFQTYMFGVAGERLTMRLRSLMYKTLLEQEMAFYDDKENGVGSLCARLAGEAASVQGATGQRIGTILNSLSTVLIALGTSFYFEWRVAFIAVCFSPLIVLSFYLEQKMIAKESQGSYDSLRKSTKIAVEAISAIRTVASLGCENYFFERYVDELEPYKKMALKNAHFRGLVYGLSRSLMFFAYSAALYYGATLIVNENIDYSRIFIVSESIVTSSWSLANALAFTPNFQKGVTSASRILELLRRTPTIRNGESSSITECNDVAYRDVHFSYPSRSAHVVLRGIDLDIIRGETIALVGPSGCGKSTIVQLLTRFYDPTRGVIAIDGVDTKRRWRLDALRANFGVVAQEPNLFSRTIGENIAYGDNSRVVGKDEIVTAAKNANIHNFIVSLPLGYDTKLGDKGTQLSGGQKQRVAIARALIRNPKILLLDEATSALDAESEKIVQEALDNARKGRTCITIAHRLTTIRDADKICVVNRGRIVEVGSHSELIGKKGLYYNLYNLQH